MITDITEPHTYLGCEPVVGSRCQGVSLCQKCALRRGEQAVREHQQHWQVVASVAEMPGKWRQGQGQGQEKEPEPSLQTRLTAETGSAL